MIYHVIVNITGAMAKRFMCKACKESRASEATHICDQTCRDCTASPPCVISDVRIPCTECNRHFRNQACFAKQKQKTSKKSICELKICCANCGSPKRKNKHECSKRYCDTYKQNREVGHLSYMGPLKYVYPANAGKVHYVFYDFETTQNKLYYDTAKTHAPILVCV